MTENGKLKTSSLSLAGFVFTRIKGHNEIIGSFIESPDFSKFQILILKLKILNTGLLSLVPKIMPDKRKSQRLLEGKFKFKGLEIYA